MQCLILQHWQLLFCSYSGFNGAFFRLNTGMVESLESMDQSMGNNTTWRSIKSNIKLQMDAMEWSNSLMQGEICVNGMLFAYVKLWSDFTSAMYASMYAHTCANGYAEIMIYIH